MSKEAISKIYGAERIGEKARDLVSRGISGKILAALPTTVYLSGARSDILWLGGKGVPAHRRCISTPFDLRSFSPGQEFHGNGHRIDLGGASIKLDSAITWAHPAPEHTLPLRDLSPLLKHLIFALLSAEIEGGLLQAIPYVLPPARGRHVGSDPSDPLVKQALPSIREMACACLRNDLLRMAQIGKELVGLGPGLTPSGDDFLGGLFFAAHTLQDVYPEEFRRGKKPVGELLEWARTRTNSISFTLLEDLAFGHAPEPLHGVVELLLSGRDPELIMPAVYRVAGIGHTSGWDLMAGFMVGMLPAVAAVNDSKN
jgi:hypothetical protein